MSESQLMDSMFAKRCSDCGTVKPLSAFPRHRQHKDGRGSICKPCVARKGREWYRKRQQRTDGLYSTYVAMKQRCHYERHEHYAQYGARGIRVCEEWRASFSAFLVWAARNGYRPGLQLDRIDNDQGYSPENCRFVTPSENAHNKRKPATPQRNNPKLTVDQIGQIRKLLPTGISLREIGRRFGVTHGTILAIKNNRSWTDVN